MRAAPAPSTNPPSAVHRAAAMLSVLVLTVIAVLALNTGAASADTASLAGTRVAASTADLGARVGSAGHVVAGQGRETAADSYDSALGCCVATKGGLPNEGGDEAIDLFRAVGVREFDSVTSSGKFIPGANSLEGRQFAFTVDEALAYADLDPSKVAILKATVDRSAIPALDFSRSIDPFIFKNGVITVQPGIQSGVFHFALCGIEHVL